MLHQTSVACDGKALLVNKYHRPLWTSMVLMGPSKSRAAHSEIQILTAMGVPTGSMMALGEPRRDIFVVSELCAMSWLTSLEQTFGGATQFLLQGPAGGAR